MIVGNEPSALQMLGKYSTTKLHSQTFSFLSFFLCFRQALTVNQAGLELVMLPPVSGVARITNTSHPILFVLNLLSASQWFSKIQFYCSTKPSSDAASHPAPICYTTITLRFPFTNVQQIPSWCSPQWGPSFPGTAYYFILVYLLLNPMQCSFQYFAE